jgi:hypothetical protein
VLVGARGGSGVGGGGCSATAAPATVVLVDYDHDEFTNPVHHLPPRTEFTIVSRCYSVRDGALGGSLPERLRQEPRRDYWEVSGDVM